MTPPRPDPPVPTLQRLPLYREVVEGLAARGETEIPATLIAQALGLNPLVVRKDLERIGAVGRPRRGFPLAELERALRGAEGSGAHEPAIVVGVGDLGRSLLRYRRFDRYGFELVAGFDADPHRCRSGAGGKPVFPMDHIASYVRSRKIGTALLAVPAGAAQEVTDILVRSGIRSILNFAPVRLTVPDHVVVGRIEIAAALAVLHHRRGAPRTRSSLGEDLMQFNV